jgi:metal-dependent amidase/aminoacylase/carboxypeptidase family protein
VEYNGQSVGVMHAYMIHMAILLGTAEVLASLKKRIKRYSKVYISTSRRRCPEEKKEAQH